MIRLLPKSEIDAEEKRLATLDSFRLLDSPAEELFDRVTRLAADVLKTPIALISLVDQERQWFKSRHGLDASETPREISFCTHAIVEDEVMVVPNALSDPRFKQNPLVIGEPNIRFYAGAPLRTANGQKIGTLCVIDREPREFDEAQSRILADLAALVVNEIETRQHASSDPLTGALNRRSFFELGEKEMRRAQRYPQDLSLMLFDIDCFRAINEAHGHLVGDKALASLAALCRSLLREQDIFGRLGGEEFGVLLPHTPILGAQRLAERLRLAVAGLEIDCEVEGIKLTVSLAVSHRRDQEESLSVLLARADDALSSAKSRGRNRVEVATAA